MALPIFQDIYHDPFREPLPLGKLPERMPVVARHPPLSANPEVPFPAFQNGHNPVVRKPVLRRIGGEGLAIIAQKTVGRTEPDSPFAVLRCTGDNAIREAAFLSKVRHCGSIVADDGAMACFEIPSGKPEVSTAILQDVQDRVTREPLLRSESSEALPIVVRHACFPGAKPEVTIVVL